MCHEPVEGMAYFVEQLEIDTQSPEAENSKLISSAKSTLWLMGNVAQVVGSLITAAQECCRTGLLDWSPRLMLAMYACDIQASSKIISWLPIIFKLC